MASMTIREPSVDEIREYLLTMLNLSLRRPGMYGGEIALRLYLDAVGFAHGRADVMEAEISFLRHAGAFLPTGVSGAFQRLWGFCSLDMMSSVYVELARRQGWLRADQVMPEAEYRELAQISLSWCGQDRSFSETLAAFGPPCLSGGNNLRFPQTLTYVPRSMAQPCLSFHFWNNFVRMDGRVETEFPEPMLLAVRRESDCFEDSLTFTSRGRRYRDDELERRRQAGQP